MQTVTTTYVFDIYAHMLIVTGVWVPWISEVTDKFSSRYINSYTDDNKLFIHLSSLIISITIVGAYYGKLKVDES